MRPRCPDTDTCRATQGKNAASLRGLAFSPSTFRASHSASEDCATGVARPDKRSAEHATNKKQEQAFNQCRVIPSAARDLSQRRQRILRSARDDTHFAAHRFIPEGLTSFRGERQWRSCAVLGSDLMCHGRGGDGADALVGGGSAHHQRVARVGADDLQADRQAVAIEAAGNRRGGLAREIEG